MDDVQQKIDYLTETIELERYDGSGFQTRAELVMSLIQEGQLDRAEEWIDDTLDLDVDWSMFLDFHRPVVDQYIRSGHVERAQPLILHASEHWEEGGKVKRMIRKAEKALTETISSSFFPSDLSVTEWWDGPHLVADSDHLDEWIPGQVSDVDDGDVIIEVASLDDDNTLDQSTWHVPVDDMTYFTSRDDDPSNWIGDHLEIGIYRDDSVDIQFH